MPALFLAFPVSWDDQRPLVVPSSLSECMNPGETGYISLQSRVALAVAVCDLSLLLLYSIPDRHQRTLDAIASRDPGFHYHPAIMSSVVVMDASVAECITSHETMDQRLVEQTRSRASSLHQIVSVIASRQLLLLP